MATREVTIRLMVEEPTLESMSALVSELRQRPDVQNASILELESTNLSFEESLKRVLNRYSKAPETTPDFIQVEWLKGCLDTWNRLTSLRDTWYGFKP